MRAADITGRGARRRAFAARCLLLGALVVGILGMHVLTGGDAMDHPGAVPASATSAAAAPGPSAMTHGRAAPYSDLSPTAAHGTPGLPMVDPHTPRDDHDAMIGCILFIVLGAMLALLILAVFARGRRVDDHRPGLASPFTRWRRGPPQWPAPRLILCVDRI